VAAHLGGHFFSFILGWRSWFSEPARVLVRFDHFASRIVNADHGIMRRSAALLLATSRA
jgi:hypothetical protein